MSDFTPRPTIHAQSLCAVHQRELVHGVMRLAPSQEWQAAILVMNLLLFQALTADARVHARAGGKSEDLSLVLAELGPPCCAVRNSVLQRVYRIMLKGLSHAAAVSQRKVIDPDFDITTLTSTLKNGKVGG